MSISTADLIAGAKTAAGKEDDPSVSDEQWRQYVNKAIKAAWRKVARQFGDSWIRTLDFSVVSPANSAAMPSDFEQLRKLTRDPTLATRRTILPFNLQEADSFRGGDPRRRVMGRTVYLEPPEASPGNYRAWYVPRPSLLVSQDYVVRVAIGDPTNGDGSFPGGPGPGQQILNDSNGTIPASQTDGVLLVPGDLMLLYDEGDARTSPPPANLHNGVYVVNVNDDAHVFRATRVAGIDTAAAFALGKTVAVLEGTQNGGTSWTVSVAPAAIDVNPLGFTNANVSLQVGAFASRTLDPILEPYNEYIETYAAALALEGEKSDSSEQRARLKEMEDDIEVLADTQEAGGQTAIADVEEFSDTRFRRHPLP